MSSWSKVSQIDASHFDNQTAYVAVNRIRCDDQAPYIYKTNDGGATWKKIVAGLPNEPINTVREDAVKKGNAFGYYNNSLGNVYGSMKSVLPYVIPGALGAGALSQQKYGGQPCYECGGMYADGGYYDCPDQEKDPVTGKCKADEVRSKQANAANKAATTDMNAWAKQVAAMDKEIARQNAAQAAGQLTFDYDWMGSPVDKSEKKAAMGQYKQFFQQNPNTFIADDTSGYSPEPVSYTHLTLPTNREV